MDKPTTEYFELHFRHNSELVLYEQIILWNGRKEIRQVARIGKNWQAISTFIASILKQSGYEDMSRKVFCLNNEHGQKMAVLFVAVESLRDEHKATGIAKKIIRMADAPASAAAYWYAQCFTENDQHRKQGLRALRLLLEE